MKRILVLIAILLTMPSVLGLSTQILDTDPRPVQSGNYADITVLFENRIDEERKDVKVRLVSTDDIRVVGRSEYSINRMRFADAFSRTFRVLVAEDLPTGNIPLELVIEYDDNVVKTATKDLQIRRGESLPDLRLGSITSVPSELIKDSKSNKLILDLKNIGDRPARLLLGELSGEGIKESTTFSLRDTVSEVSINKPGVLEFTFDIEDVSDNILNLELHLQYVVEDALRNNLYQSKTLDLEVGLARVPDIKVVSQELLDDAKLGQSDNTLKVTIENQGEEARNVRIRLYPDVSYPLDFQRTSQFVSSWLKEGETTSFEISFDVLRNAEIRDYPINIEIESMVGENRYFQEDRIEISVTGEALSLPELVRNVVLVISFIIAIGFGYNTYRKRRK